MNRITKFTVPAVVGWGLTLALIPTDAHAASTIRSKALSTAAAQKYDPYSPGAAGPNAFDCSGLTYYSYKQHGKTLPRTAQGQYNKSSKVSASNRKVGDLVFIGRSSGSIYHVGIYAGFKDGKGWMWNANSGSYRGRKVVKAPIKEYTAGSPKAYYGRFNG
ncbi:C40 family peptidase [Streptomyces sp. NPDC058947]|uniref:C40 family peptidase n=1 Tax=Streptomyces sp. NPDC058947 TaxID=3346675 RepID=UPI0036C30315